MQTFKTPDAMFQSEHQKWKEANAKKPTSSTPEQMEAIRQHAIKSFGTTNRFENAFYMLPDGTMLDGTGGYGFGRMVDHRDIGDSYHDSNVDLAQIEEGGNSHNMLDFMRAGNLRLIPETNAIDVMAKPTEQQLNRIYNLWRLGKIKGIEASDPKTRSGSQLGYLGNINNEEQIAAFLNRYFR